MLDLEPLMKRRASGLTRRPEAEDLAGPRPGARGRGGDPVRRATDRDRPAPEMAAAAQAQGGAHRFRHTLVYVTHDQNEALTFAEKVVVMYNGEVVQLGTPQELFERPAHRFVGYFIGSPGMNFMPCRPGRRRRADRGHRGRARDRTGPGPRARCPTRRWSWASGPSSWPSPAGPDDTTLPAQVERVDDLGNYKLVTRAPGPASAQGQAERGRRGRRARRAHLAFAPARTLLYADGRLIG